MGLLFVGVAPVVLAEPTQSITDENSSIPEQGLDLSSPRGDATLLFVEPRGLDVSEGADAEDLNNVAAQINQEIANDASEEFLPDGMVVRGSNRSLQVGSEL